MRTFDEILDQLVDTAGYVDRLEGKISSALAIVDGPTFGAHDGDLGDAVTILRSAVIGSFLGLR